VPVAVMDPFRRIRIPNNPALFDRDFVMRHAAQGAIAVGLALRRPGDRFT